DGRGLLRRGGAGGACRAPTRGRGRPCRRTADLRRRPDTGLRVGTERRPRGRCWGGGAPGGDVRSVRAATARAALVPAGHPGCLRRRRAAASPRGAPLLLAGA